MRISTENGGNITENRTLIDAISRLMADFLRLINVNAGGFRLKKGPGNFTPKSQRCPLLRAMGVFGVSTWRYPLPLF